MLIVTIGPRKSSPDLIPLLEPLDDVVAVLLPGHALSRRQIEGLQDNALVIEYLSAPAGAVNIMAEVVAKLERFGKPRGGPLVLIHRKQTVSQVSSLLGDLGDSGMIVMFGAADQPEVVGFSSTIAQNPLLPRFFALLIELDIKEKRGLELLQQTFGDQRV